MIIIIKKINDQITGEYLTNSVYSAEHSTHNNIGSVVIVW